MLTAFGLMNQWHFQWNHSASRRLCSTTGNSFQGILQYSSKCALVLKQVQCLFSLSGWCYICSVTTLIPAVWQKASSNWRRSSCLTLSNGVNVLKLVSWQFNDSLWSRGEMNPVAEISYKLENKERNGKMGLFEYLKRWCASLSPSLINKKVATGTVWNLSRAVLGDSYLNNKSIHYVHHLSQNTTGCSIA